MADLGIFIKTTFDNKGVKAAEKSFGGVAKKGKEAATKTKSSFAGLDKAITGQLAGLASGFGLAFGAKELADLAIGTFKAAEEAKVATSAFTNLSGSANIARLNLQAMDRATKGLISDTEQMKIANQLLGMNIVQTSDQLEQVVGVSRRLGKEFKGLGAKDAAEEFAIMIANMSVARLDSFGLSSGRVRERINELMATVKGMTRETAFFQATMEEAEGTVIRLGPEISTASEEASRLAAEWANLRVVMGEAAEGTGIIKNISAGLADNLVLLRNWSEAGADINTKQQALEIQIKRTQAALEDNTTGLITSSNAAAKNELALVRLQLEYDQVTLAIGDATQAAEKEQAALQAAIASEEKAAENLANRTAATKKLADAQKQFAKDVTDIQSETQDRLSESQDQFDDNSLKAAEDHTKRITELRKRAADTETKSAKKLQKDILKLDKNVKKSIVKQQIDEDKQIAKTQANFIKEDKKQRRQKQIDAAGDERLFQFELRNLAADGQGIAIKQALERRQIEQEIAGEKAEFEKQTEAESRKDTIDSMRQEGQEARSQLQQQATERKADLELRNQEAAQARTERLQEEILQENEGFAQKKVDLGDALGERNEKIKESEQDRVAEIAKGLAETEELTLAQFDKMIALAEEFGPQFGQTFADGMTKAFSEALDIEKKIEDANVADIGAGAGGLPVARGTNGTASSGSAGIQPFATGADITQSGVGFLHKGEVVANPTEGQAINIGGEQFAVREAARLAASINAMRQQDMQELVDTVAANL